MGKVIVGIGLLAACGGRRPSPDSRRDPIDVATETAATQRAVVALSCPESELTATSIGGGGAVVRGCGLQQSYTCVSERRNWRYEAVCQPDGAPTEYHAVEVRDQASAPPPAPK